MFPVALCQKKCHYAATSGALDKYSRCFTYTSPHVENTEYIAHRGAKLPCSFWPCPPLKLWWPSQWLSIAETNTFS